MKPSLIPVQILHLLILKIGSLDLFPGPECPVNNVTSEQTLEFGTDESSPFARFDMLELDDGERFTLEFDLHAPFKLVCTDQFISSPFVVLRDVSSSRAPIRASLYPTGPKPRAGVIRIPL